MKILVQHSKWNDELLGKMSELRSSGMLCDTTLECCDGVPVRAHSCVLAAASQRVKSLLSGAALGYYTLHMRDVTSTTWQHVLHFVYDGQVLLELTDIDSVYEAAVRFEIVRLAEALRESGAVSQRRKKEARPANSSADKVPNSGDIIEICDDDDNDETDLTRTSGSNKDKTNSSVHGDKLQKSADEGNTQPLSCSSVINNELTNNTTAENIDTNPSLDAGGDSTRRKGNAVEPQSDNLFERFASSTTSSASTDHIILQTCCENEGNSDITSATLNALETNATSLNNVIVLNDDEDEVESKSKDVLQIDEPQHSRCSVKQISHAIAVSPVNQPSLDHGSSSSSTCQAHSTVSNCTHSSSVSIHSGTIHSIIVTVASVAAVASSGSQGSRTDQTLRAAVDVWNEPRISRPTAGPVAAAAGHLLALNSSTFAVNSDKTLYDQIQLSKDPGRVSLSNNNKTLVSGYPLQPLAVKGSVIPSSNYQANPDQGSVANRRGSRGKRATATRSRGRGRGVATVVWQTEQSSGSRNSVSSDYILNECGIDNYNNALGSSLSSLSAHSTSSNGQAVTRGGASGRRGRARKGTLGFQGAHSAPTQPTFKDYLPSVESVTQSSSLTNTVHNLASYVVGMTQSSPVTSIIDASAIHRVNAIPMLYATSHTSIPATVSISTSRPTFQGLTTDPLREVPNASLSSAAAVGSCQSISNLASAQRRPRQPRLARCATAGRCPPPNQQVPVVFPTPLQNVQIKPSQQRGITTPMAARRASPAQIKSPKKGSVTTESSELVASGSYRRDCSDGMSHSASSSVEATLTSADGGSAETKNKGRRKRTSSIDNDDAKRMKNIQFVGRRIRHEWIIGSKSDTRRWYIGTVVKLIAGSDGALNSRYLIKYDDEDAPYEINHLVEDYHDGSVEFL